MKLTISSLLLLDLLGSAAALPSSARSHRAVKPPQPDLDKANAVKAVFQTSWDNYYKYAFPHDQLHPVSKGYDDERNAWGATAIDALDTAVIMRNTKVVDQILAFVPKINFSTTSKANDAISVFETTIRYIGGMMSAYDLLNGPFKGVASNQAAVATLLKQATTLADSLSICFNTNSGLNDGTVYLNPTRRRSGATSNNLAEAGTLVLEWTHLSDLTGNTKYANMVQKSESYLLNPTGSPQPWDGLVGDTISTDTGKFLNSNGGWTGGRDSFYEYLIKMYLYDPKSFGQYRDRWVKAADSTMAHLTSHPTTAKDLTFLSVFSGTTTTPVSQHLTSFAGGNFILAGILLGEDKYTQYGLALTDSYYATYSRDPSGIGPEEFRWVDSNNPNGGQPPSNQQAFYNAHGFWADSAAYIQRPETMESVYYAYRATGDTKYQSQAWTAFQKIRDLTNTGTGYAGLNDVTQANGGSKIDQMQSFWLAETLKYFYLLFAEESDVQFQGQGKPNKFVFNTEAHPVKIR